MRDYIVVYISCKIRLPTSISQNLHDEVFRGKVGFLFYYIITLSFVLHYSEVVLLEFHLRLDFFD